MDENKDTITGRVKQAAGDLTDNEELSREGRRQEAAGKAKEFVDDAADEVEDAIDKVREKVD